MIAKPAEKLGISPEILSFFHARDLCFSYGDDKEIYASGFHYIPTSTNVWLAGNFYAAEVVLTNSAMEAVAWFVINRKKFRDPFALAFISLGNLPSEEQIWWLRREFPKRKFYLLFGNDLLGSITDIRVAMALLGKKVSLRWQKEKVEVTVNGYTVFLKDDLCTLNRIEKAFGVRTGVKTQKPKGYISYLAKLQHENS